MNLTLSQERINEGKCSGVGFTYGGNQFVQHTHSLVSRRGKTFMYTNSTTSYPVIEGPADQ